MTFKERAERNRQLQAERARAIQAGCVGIVERCDRELAELAREHLEASRHRPLLIPPGSLLIEDLRTALARSMDRGDRDKSAELRRHINRINEPYELRRRGVIKLVRPQ
jgi:hypothetical protein